MIQRRTFKNTRTGEVATVKDATETKIIMALNAKLWDTIEVIGADYHYEVVIKGAYMRLRTIYH